MKPTFYSGLLFVIVGLSFSLFATNYPIGSASSMGPGYFPVMLGMLLAVLGTLNIIKSIVTNEMKLSLHIAWRPLILILAANILFGLLLHSAGLFIAIFVLVVVSSNAITDSKVKETIILATLLSVVSSFIFTWALSMPLPLLPKF